MNLKCIFGKNLKYYRYRKKLTQEQLAEKLNISINYLGRIERGQHSVDFELIEKMVKILGIDASELFSKPKNTKLPKRVDMQ